MHDLIVKLCHNHPQVNASLMLVIFFSNFRPCFQNKCYKTKNPSNDDKVCQTFSKSADKSQSNSDKNLIVIRSQKDGKTDYNYCYPWEAEEIKDDEKYR